MAGPFAGAEWTLTAWPPAADSLTGKAAFLVPELPSAMLTLLIARPGTGSSLRIVPVAVAVPRIALVGLLRVAVYVSFALLSGSPTTGTVMVPEVEPAGMVSVPVLAR